MFTKKLIPVITILSLLVAGCQLGGPSASELAATMVAETQAAAPTSTTVPPATATAEPTLTPTVTLTAAPTLTPTPAGPLVIKDDFSAKSDIWEKCDKCEWKDGRLYFGPFPPNGDSVNQVFALVCKACGVRTYFRLAADLTFAAGVAGDRTFGVGLTTPGEFYGGTGIAPSQYGALEAWDFNTSKWTGTEFKLYSAIKSGRATNRVEFAVKPNSSGGVDYYAIVNGKTIAVLSNITARASATLKPSIYLGWHSVGVTVDNFEYEEIEP